MDVVTFLSINVLPRHVEPFDGSVAASFRDVKEL